MGILNISFVAAEYNPFHNGHKYLIDEIKTHGYDAVVAIMSGNFVQRGEAALCEKHLRAKTALLSGVDLIFELPVEYAISNAHYFAEGFVKTAFLSGIKGDFSFGTTGKIDELNKIADIVFSEETKNFCNEYSKNNGVSYPVALGVRIKEIAGRKIAAIASEPNNILAVEYINSIRRYFPEANINAIKRVGTNHDSLITNENFASAGFIRNEIYREYNQDENKYNLYNVKKFLPEAVFLLLNQALVNGVLPCEKGKFETAVLSRLYNYSPEDFIKINNVNQGLENRICEALRSTTSLPALYEKIKTKRYTHSRIRQIILSAALGVNREDLCSDIPYIRVLGFNDTGRQILHEIKEKSQIPIIMNLSQANKNNTEARREAELDYSAAKLFNLCLPCPFENNPEYDIPPVKI